MADMSSVTDPPNEPSASNTVERRNISVMKPLYDELWKLKGPDDTWDDVLWRLLDADPPQPADRAPAPADLHPALADFTPPGTPPQQAERLRAAQLALERIEAEGSLMASDIYSWVHERAPAGYDDPRSLWKNWLLDTLSALADELPQLSKPQSPHDTWDWEP